MTDYLMARLDECQSAVREGRASSPRPEQQCAAFVIVSANGETFMSSRIGTRDFKQRQRGRLRRPENREKTGETTRFWREVRTS